MNIEAEAREMGWVSKEEFKGHKDQWLDAEEYVLRAYAVLHWMLGVPLRNKA